MDIPELLVAILSINAEGSANDVSGAVAALVSGNIYRYTRTIVYDAEAIGVILEDISITGTDLAGNTSGISKESWDSRL